jgi:hypothetical protein
VSSIPLVVLADPASFSTQILHWDETGEVIVVKDAQRLSTELCPTVWQQKDVYSWSRQMNVSAQGLHSCPIAIRHPITDMNFTDITHRLTSRSDLEMETCRKLRQGGEGGERVTRDQVVEVEA